MPLSEILLITVALLGLAILLAGLFRRVAIPYTVLLVMIGMALSELSKHWALLDELHHFILTPDLVFFLFLPALIFASGLTLNTRQLVKNLAPVMALAVPALILSTGVIGIGIWWALGIDFATALLFGALISATDPVAVIGLFKELGAPVRLNVLVEGESLFNDATAIVVFGILLGIVISGKPLDFGGMLYAAVEFLRVFFGGVVVGSLIGLSLCELMHRLRIDLRGILTLSLVMAYASFILAEHILHVSGVMATVAAALILGSFGVNRLPAGTDRMLAETWEFLELIANSLLFLLVGLSINLDLFIGHVGAITVAVLLVLVGRASTLYTLVPLTTRFFRLPKVRRQEQHIMWWGGLKGGLAIAIALSIPESVPGRDLLLTLTLGVVLFTLLVNAPTIRPLMKRLQMDRLTEEELSELQQGYQLVLERGNKRLQAFRGNDLLEDEQLKQLQLKLTSQLPQEASLQEGDVARHRTYLLALQTELQALDELFNSDVISQYTYLDIRNTLIMDRERHRLTNNRGELPPAKTSLFVSFERAVVRKLRERNWASRLLARYQHFRLLQRVQRDVAGVVMCHRVLEVLNNTPQLEAEECQRLLDLYQERLQRRMSRIREMRAGFPSAVPRFEHKIYLQAAYVTALTSLEKTLHEGQIGAKPYQHLKRKLDALISAIPPLAEVWETDGLCDWTTGVPLFEGLSSEARAALRRQAVEVTYLANDIIIGEGERGDALYVIQQGEVEISRQGKPLGLLKTNDFFGEKALLGDHERTASVRAVKPTTLWRLSRRSVLHRAEQDKELRQHLDRWSRMRNQ